jgi:hypothetical protein
LVPEVHQAAPETAIGAAGFESRRDPAAQPGLPGPDLGLRGEKCLGTKKMLSNNLLSTRTQHRHTHQITDQDECRPGQSEKNDEEVKGERGVKVKRVQGGKGQEERREGKESWKQAESEEEEEGGEIEQQRQEGGGEKANDERAGERRSDRQGRSGGQGCGRRHVHKLPQRQQW